MATSSPRRRIIGLSTKMYFTAARTKDFTTQVISLLSQLSPSLVETLDIFLIPDFLTLADVSSQLSGTSSDAGTNTTSGSGVKIWAGAQDTHWEDSGAFTGEVSPVVLASLGVRIVEVGHAERRRLFHEDDEITALKAAATARNGMIPLVCIGEKMKPEAANIHAAVQECRVQVEPVVQAVGDDAEIVLAYEPVWAIGASEPAGEEHVLRVVEGIRTLECVQKRRGMTRVVYGGSAGPGLFAKLSGGLDGLFLGRFGHDPERFVKTVQEVAEA